MTIDTPPPFQDNGQSLAQIDIVRDPAGISKYATIEFGWLTTKGTKGNGPFNTPMDYPTPQLFIAARNVSVWLGPWKQQWQCIGTIAMIHRSGNCNNHFSLAPGASDRDWQLGSTVAGTGQTHGFRVNYRDGAWFFEYDGKSIGRLDKNYWAPAFSGGDIIQWQGETKSTRAHPCIAMGNGKLGTTSGSARIADLFYDASGHPGRTGAKATMDGQNNHNPAFDGSPAPRSAVEYHAGFSYGGPGYCNASSNSAGSGSNPGANQPSGQPVTAIDWRNGQYTVTCGGTALQPFTVDVHDGVGEVTGTQGQSSVRYDVRVLATVFGDLTGDGNPEAAVLLYCSPQPSNFAVTELEVFAAGRQRLDDLLPPQQPSGALFPAFDENGISIKNGQLVTTVKRYGSGDTHASGPSITEVVTWRWDGHHLVVTPHSQSATGQGYASASQAADAGTDKVLSRTSGTDACVRIVKGDLRGSPTGNAAVLSRDIHCMVDASGGPGYVLFVYVFQDSAGWHYLDARGTQSPGFLPAVGAHLTLQLKGCANVRSAPSTSAGVSSCLPSGSEVTIDGGPTYSDGHMWWRLAGRGWMVHELVTCTGYQSEYLLPSNC